MATTMMERACVYESVYEIVLNENKFCEKRKAFINYLKGLGSDSYIANLYERVIEVLNELHKKHEKAKSSFKLLSDYVKTMPKIYYEHIYSFKLAAEASGVDVSTEDVDGIFHSILDAMFKDHTKSVKASSATKSVSSNFLTSTVNHTASGTEYEAMVRISGAGLARANKLFKSLMGKKGNIRQLKASRLQTFMKQYILMPEFEKDDLPVHLKIRNRGGMLFPRTVYMTFLVDLSNQLHGLLEDGLKSEKQNLPKMVAEEISKNVDLFDRFRSTINVLRETSADFTEAGPVDETTIKEFYRLWTLKIVHASVNEKITAHFQREYNLKGQVNRGGLLLRDRLAAFASLKGKGKADGQPGKKGEVQKPKKNTVKNSKEKTASAEDRPTDLTSSSSAVSTAKSKTVVTSLKGRQIGEKISQLGKKKGAQKLKAGAEQILQNRREEPETKDRQTNRSTNTVSTKSRAGRPIKMNRKYV